MAQATTGCISLSAAAAAALLLAASPGARAAGDSAFRVQRVEIIDARGFERPMVAVTMLVPADWRVQSQVEWPQLPCTKPYHVRLQARAADGVGGLDLYGGHGWGSSNTGAIPAGCPPAQITSAQAYLQGWVQQQRPGARVLDYRPRPERSRSNQYATGTGSIRTSVDTGQAVIAYTHNGVAMREVLAVAVSVGVSQMAAPGMPTMVTMQGESLGVLAWRLAEKDLSAAEQLKRFDAMWATYTTQPEWKSRIDAGTNQMARDNQRTGERIGQIQAEGSRQTLNEVARRGELARQSREEIADIHARGQRDRAATDDRMHRESVRTVREVEHYRDPPGPGSRGVVELSNHYRHAWKLKDGSYVLTDDQNFDPQRTLGQSGTVLQRAPR